MKVNKFYKNVVSNEQSCVKFLTEKELLPVNQNCQRVLNGIVCGDDFKEVLRKKGQEKGQFIKICICLPLRSHDKL